LGPGDMPEGSGGPLVNNLVGGGGSQGVDGNRV